MEGGSSRCHTLQSKTELCDPDFVDNSEVRRRAKRQALIIKHLESRWKHEYLTALREAHRTTGTNTQQVKIGDIVLVHDDTTRVNWKLAVIESVNRGADGMIRSANIRTANGRTNCPIARLYPLEVSAAEETVKPSIMKASERSDTPVPPRDQCVKQPREGNSR